MTIKEQLERARLEDYLTVSQFALLTQVNPKTIYRLIASNRLLGVVRFGRALRIHKTEAVQSLPKHVDSCPPL
jgi:excisionase family DNA binding protein